MGNGSCERQRVDALRPTHIHSLVLAATSKETLFEFKHRTFKMGRNLASVALFSP